MTEEIKKAKLKDLVLDDKNFNKGTERGRELIGKSLREFGAGRSVLIDKNNRIIAGNKTRENAELAGLDDVIIVETDGTKLVAVKRTDIDLDSKEGREMALADNATVKVDLEWDEETMREVGEEWGLDFDEWGVYLAEGFNIDDFFDEVQGIRKANDDITIQVRIPKEEKDEENNIRSILDEALKAYPNVTIV